MIDAAGKIRYHGRIDDQFVARRKRNANPSASELKDAITRGPERERSQSAGGRGRRLSIARDSRSRVAANLLQGRGADSSEKLPGMPSAGAGGSIPARDVRPGEKARLRYRRRWPRVGRCRRGRPILTSGVKFKDVRTLSEHDIAILAAWAEADAPEGNPADLPPPPKFADDWQLGTPDLVVDIGADFPVPASGDDIYRCFVVPTHLEKDQYVSAVEYRPGNRRVVHHILAFVDTSGKARERDQAEPGPGYTCFGGPGEPIHGGLGGWAPGNQASFLPDGIGRSLPRQSDIIVQVHYHPQGKAETDRSKIGLYFAKKPIKQVMHWGIVINPGLELPPGQSNIEVKAAWEVPVDVTAHSVAPHMHLLGRDMQISVKFPDGHVQDLIKIPDWDFNWQYTYQFEKPLDIPKGSLVYLVSHYDNSEANPNNPHKPPKLVKWGEATTDEMCIGFLGLTKKGQDLTKPGEKDDFMDILRKQEEELRAKYEKQFKERRKKDPTEQVTRVQRVEGSNKGGRLKGEKRPRFCGKCQVSPGSLSIRWSLTCWSWRGPFRS